MKGIFRKVGIGAPCETVVATRAGRAGTVTSDNLRTPVLGIWREGVGDVFAQLLRRNDVPKGQSGGVLSPMLETLRAGHAARWVEGPRVLDCGCGRSRILSMLGSEVSYTGIDRDPALVEHLRRVYPGSEFLCSDVEDLSIAEDTRFDSIVMMALFEHLASPTTFLKKLASLLRPGGRLILTTPAPSFEFVLWAGSKLALFSRHAEEEHEGLSGRQEVENALIAAGLEPEFFTRFLFGANQLLIARKSADSEATGSAGTAP
jgi:2-polyprenyl-3-methyl-5-hydroxy-6-metoxy-1,4-benzoquinol methylase